MFNNTLPNIFPGAVQLGANVNPSPPDIQDGAIQFEDSGEYIQFEGSAQYLEFETI